MRVEATLHRAVLQRYAKERQVARQAPALSALPSASIQLFRNISERHILLAKVPQHMYLPYLCCRYVRHFLPSLERALIRLDALEEACQPEASVTRALPVTIC
jgi:hypothetical protein